VLAACASGGSADVDSGTTGGGDGMVRIDSGMPTIDAPPGTQTRTLTQTTSQTIKAAASIACGNASYTRSNNYYRVFDLPAMGITGAFHVTQVSFQIEHCHNIAGGSGATVAVRVGTYSAAPGATLANANMTILASNATVSVPEVIEDVSTTPPTTPGGTVNAPITATIPAGSKLLVEVDAPDGINMYKLYMGANDGGESGFGYILAPDCTITVPTNISSVAAMYPSVHLLLTVTGTY
jgi:hypothetical protein